MKKKKKKKKQERSKKKRIKKETSGIRTSWDTRKSTKRRKEE